MRNFKFFSDTVKESKWKEKKTSLPNLPIGKKVWAVRITKQYMIIQHTKNPGVSSVALGILFYQRSLVWGKRTMHFLVRASRWRLNDLNHEEEWLLSHSRGESQNLPQMNWNA